MSRSFFYGRVIAEHQISRFIGLPLGAMSALVCSQQSRFSLPQIGEALEHEAKDAHSSIHDCGPYICSHLRRGACARPESAGKAHLVQDFPGKYESYADMVACEWIKMRIEVHGKRANLFLDDAPQPVLVVTDLTQEQGRIALWVGTDTVAHFANLRITPSN